MEILAKLNKFQNSRLVRGCEVSRVLCPIVSGIGNIAVGIIRAFGYAYNAAVNGVNSRILKNSKVIKPTEFKSAFIQIGWGILMAIPYFGSEIGRVRLGAVANATAKRVAVLSSSPSASV